MLGDFNAEPNSLDLAKEMIEDQQWVDVGERAEWWGGTANQKTCQTRPQAKPTRIDGILASREAVAWIANFCRGTGRHDTDAHGAKNDSARRGGG